MNTLARGLVTATVLLAAASPAQAQLGFLRGVRFSGGALVYAARQGSDVEQISRTGTWKGLEGAAQKGRVTVRLSGMMGTLGGTATADPQDVRETTLGVSYAVRPWLEVGVEGEALRLESQASTAVVWRLYGVRVGVSPPLGVDGLVGHADFVVYPLTGVVAARALRRPMRAEVGLSWAPPGWPVEARFAYRAEHIDFEDTNDLRIAGLLGGIAVRFGAVR
jgi:hypothetical protein